MLLEDAYRTHWGEAFALVRDDHVLTITGSGYDFRTRIASCTITMFRLLDTGWRRSDVVVRERCYTTAEIGTALQHAGFGELSCYSACDLGMAGQLGEGRIFFVATRRAGNLKSPTANHAAPRFQRGGVIFGDQYAHSVVLALVARARHAPGEPL